MKYNIEFYQDNKQKYPVSDFIKTVSAQEKAKIVWVIDLLELTGPNITEPYAKHIEDKLWELKPKGIRILYFMEKHTFILLHAFKKKTQKLPPHEKEIALKRMEVYLKRRKI